MTPRPVDGELRGAREDSWIAEPRIMSAVCASPLCSA
jgi:hypothetical protein